ncbi:MAG: 6-pyruvoyl tetrahydropterin synthase family protein [Campylobacterales bacterium]
MIIRKLFKFENAHIVRGCLTERCRESIHGHSYKVELLLEAGALDHGQMVMDFSRVKTLVKELIDSFDHSVAIWREDSPEYIEAMKRLSKRWVVLPVSPSAEQFARVILMMADRVISAAEAINGEGAVQVHSVIVHETETGYAQAFKADVNNPKMGLLNPAEFEFSRGVRDEWSDPLLWEKSTGLAVS